MMSPDSDNPSTPERYKLESLLHEGPTGELYRGHDTQADQSVLLKITSTAISRDPDFKRYIHNRWTDQEQLFEHPNIAQVVEIGRWGKRHFMAVEDPGGTNLSDKMEEAPCEPHEMLDICQQITEGLRAAHRRDIVHGHLKPTDIYITTDKAGHSIVKIVFLDLGTVADDSVMPFFGETQGTPKYMAPEVIRGQTPGKQADIFSLGVIAYELLTGQEPFESSHPIGYLFANCEASYVPPREVYDDVMEELSRVVSRCLERDTNSRYKSIQRVNDDLDRCEQVLKTGQVSVVPAGTDSAFAQEYTVQGSGADGRPSPSRITPLNLLAVILALGALATTLYFNYDAVRETTAGLPDIGNEPSAQLEKQTSDQSTEETPEKRSESSDDSEEPSRDDSESDESTDQATRASAQIEYESLMEDWKNRYSLQGNYEQALAEFQKIESKYTNTIYANRARLMQAQIHYEWARKLQKDENPEKAIEHYKQARNIDVEDNQYAKLADRHLPEVMAGYAKNCLDRGKYGKALELYEEINNSFPQTAEAALLSRRKPEILLNQAFIAWQQNEAHEEALDTFQELLNNHPDSEAAEEARSSIPELHLDIARKSMESGDLEKAVEQFEKVQDSFEGSDISEEAAELEADVMSQLYDRLRSEGKEADADKLAETLIYEQPGSEAAQKLLRERLELVPDDGEVMLERTTAKSRLEEASKKLDKMEYGKAISQLRSVIEYTRADSDIGRKALEELPRAHYAQALYELGKGNRSEFRAALEEIQEDFGYAPVAEQAKKTLEDEADAPDGMVYVPEGPFRMGLDKNEIVKTMKSHYPDRILDSEGELELVLETEGYHREIPSHIVSTSAFYISTTEVTNKEYKEFIDDTDSPAPETWDSRDYPEGQGDMPVQGVTYEQAKGYAEWAGQRLPSEIQWEKAARGTDGRLFPWGDRFDEDYARHMQKKDAGPTSVGSLSEGASPYGALDMTGNVWEWTRSRFSFYEDNPLASGSGDTDDDYRILRGGAWSQQSLKPIPTRVTFRLPAPRDRNSESIGFRCIQPVE